MISHVSVFFPPSRASIVILSRRVESEFIRLHQSVSKSSRQSTVRGMVANITPRTAAILCPHVAARADVCISQHVIWNITNVLRWSDGVYFHATTRRRVCFMISTVAAPVSILHSSQPFAGSSHCQCISRSTTYMYVRIVRRCILLVTRH